MPSTRKLQTSLTASCSAAVTAAPLKRRRFRQLQFLPSIAAVTNDPAVTRGNLWLEPTTACSAAVSALNNICSVMSESVALHCVVSVLQLHEVKTTEMARKPTLGFNHQSAGWPLCSVARLGSNERERLDCGLQICGRRLFLQRCNCHRNELDPGPGLGSSQQRTAHTSLQYTFVQL